MANKKQTEAKKSHIHTHMPCYTHNQCFSVSDTNGQRVAVKKIIYYCQRDFLFSFLSLYFVRSFFSHLFCGSYDFHLFSIVSLSMWIWNEKSMKFFVQVEIYFNIFMKLDSNRSVTIEYSTSPIWSKKYCILLFSSIKILYNFYSFLILFFSLSQPILSQQKLELYRIS